MFSPVFFCLTKSLVITCQSQIFPQEFVHPCSVPEFLPHESLVTPEQSQTLPKEIFGHLIFSTKSLFTTAPALLLILPRNLWSPLVCPGFCIQNLWSLLVSVRFCPTKSLVTTGQSRILPQGIFGHPWPVPDFAPRNLRLPLGSPGFCPLKSLVTACQPRILWHEIFVHSWLVLDFALGNLRSPLVIPGFCPKKSLVPPGQSKIPHEKNLWPPLVTVPDFAPRSLWSPVYSPIFRPLNNWSPLVSLGFFPTKCYVTTCQSWIFGFTPKKSLVTHVQSRILPQEIFGPPDQSRILPHKIFGHPWSVPDS
jgi:hypothetical protein